MVVDSLMAREEAGDRTGGLGGLEHIVARHLRLLLCIAHMSPVLKTVSKCLDDA